MLDDVVDVADGVGVGAGCGHGNGLDVAGGCGHGYGFGNGLDVADGDGNGLREPSDVKARWAPAIPTVVFDTYWRFAAERQRIFFRRARNEDWPWTDDPILEAYKFTNAYRASDRVSQYLIREVICQGDQEDEETVFRILLFKLFNKIETWQLLREELGQPRLREFSLGAYDRVLAAAMDRGERIYSAAYIMPSGGSAFGYRRKHTNHLALLDKMMNDDLPRRLRHSSGMAEAFTVMKSYPSIGDFLAYQFVTDINYSNVTDFSEMEFVVPGPGARSGIRKCFASLGGLSEDEVILLTAQRQDDEFARLGLRFERIGDRPLQLIDCQNLFCETDKYARLAHPTVEGIGARTRIKQQFRPNWQRFPLKYPAKWEIEDSLREQLRSPDADQGQEMPSER